MELALIQSFYFIFPRLSRWDHVPPDVFLPTRNPVSSSLDVDRSWMSTSCSTSTSPSPGFLTRVPTEVFFPTRNPVGSWVVATLRVIGTRRIVMMTTTMTHAEMMIDGTRNAGDARDSRTGRGPPVSDTPLFAKNKAHIKAEPAAMATPMIAKVRLYMKTTGRPIVLDLWQGGFFTRSPIRVDTRSTRRPRPGSGSRAARGACSPWLRGGGGSRSYRSRLS